MKGVWLIEERLSKRGAWTLYPIFPDSKKDAQQIAKNYRERAADWSEWEYRVVKYVREEPRR